MRILAQATRRWDGGYELRFPYSRNLVEALKANIPADYREYEPSSKTWIVDADFAATAIQLLRAVSPDATVDGRGETSSQPPPMQRSNPHARLYVLPDAPRCVVDAAYEASGNLSSAETAYREAEAAYEDARRALQAADLERGQAQQTLGLCQERHGHLTRAVAQHEEEERRWARELERDREMQEYVGGTGGRSPEAA